jgi:integral membrane protein
MTPAHETELRERIRLIRQMRLASMLEATTLALLVFVAMPLKYGFGLDEATSILGPVHGLAFLYYLWVLIQVVLAGGWTRAAILRMVLSAFIPLAGFINERLLLQHQRQLAATTP